jgi:glycosyltransferase involved in cell wall biosynthesis
MSAKLLVAMTVGPVQTWLKEALDSILASEFRDFELVVLFDGVPASIPKPLDPRVRWAELPEKIGRAPALKMALEKIGWESPLLCWVDADDKIEPDALGLCVAKLDANPKAGFVSTGYRLVNAEGKFIANVPPAPHSPGRHPFNLHLAVIRREIYQAAGGIDKTRPLAMDLDLMLRCERQCAEVAVINKALYTYRRHSKSLGSMNRRDQFQSARQARAADAEANGGVR